MTVASQTNSSTHGSLQARVSQPRFQTYLDVAKGDPQLAGDLYVWNRDLSVAILADIAILEVALRNAMHEAASQAWGTHWYSDAAVVLDERSANQLATAWGYLPRSVKQRARDEDVPGRLIAGCMFGFWTNLLDEGSYIGKPPRRIQADYENLWQDAFAKAFPGGRNEARRQRNILIANLPDGPGKRERTLELRNEVSFSRQWVHSILKVVNQLRNRVAHHEAMINGFPIRGQARRATPEEAHEYCRILARMLDRDLALWLDSNTKVPSLLVSKPVI